MDRAALTLVPVGAGALALTHRPKKTALAEWAQAGVTHVVTLLGEREDAKSIGDATARAGLAWIWIPLPNGDPPSPERTAELRVELRRVVDALAAGGRVVVHCSAGIHRTGMIGYAILRLAGLEAAAARATLAEIRAVTADGVGAERLAWGDAL